MRVIDDFFPRPATIQLYVAAEKLLTESVWRINKTTWGETLTNHYEGAVYSTLIDNIDNNLSGFPKANDIREKIQTAFDKRINWNECKVLMNIWDYNSGINWHQDSHCDFGMTIFLNHKWEDHWGGHFEYLDDNQIKVIKPECGKCIINDDQLWHSVSKINTRTPRRVTLQLFGKFYNEESIQE